MKNKRNQKAEKVAERYKKNTELFQFKDELTDLSLQSGKKTNDQEDDKKFFI